MEDKETGVLMVRIDNKIKADLLVVSKLCGLSLVKVIESVGNFVMYGQEDLHWHAVKHAIMINRRNN